MHVEYKPDSFIKRVSHVDLDMTWIHLTLAYNMFINRLVVLGSQVVSNFVTPNFLAFGVTFEWCILGS